MALQVIDLPGQTCFVQTHRGDTTDVRPQWPEHELTWMSVLVWVQNQRQAPVLPGIHAQPRQIYQGYGSNGTVRHSAAEMRLRLPDNGSLRTDVRVYGEEYGEKYHMLKTECWRCVQHGGPRQTCELGVTTVINMSVCNVTNLFV